MPGPTNHNPSPGSPVSNDRLLDHAQGRLSPAELAEISRLMAEDPGLQQRYAQIRRMRRLVRESYQPPAVARPDARDEEVAGMIAEFVDAIRSGVMPEPDEQMLAAVTAGAPSDAGPEEWDESTISGHVISGPWPNQAGPASVASLSVASGHSGRQWRRLGSYAAAAVLLLGLVLWSVANDQPLVDRQGGTGTMATDTIVLTPLDQPDEVDFDVPGHPDDGGDDGTRPDHVDNGGNGASDQPVDGSDRPVAPDDAGPRDTVDQQPEPGPTPDPQDGTDQPGPGASIDAPTDPGSDNAPAGPTGFDPEQMIAAAGDALRSGPVVALTGATNTGAESADQPRYLVSRPPRLPGDIDGNGVVDRADEARLKRHVLRGTTDRISLSVGDLTNDGRIDVSDWSALWAATGR